MAPVVLAEVVVQQELAVPQALAVPLGQADLQALVEPLVLLDLLACLVIDLLRHPVQHIHFKQRETLELLQWD